MLEDYLKIFNDYLEVQNIDEALNYIDKIFIDSKYLRTKNLFLYLLGCITELPTEYLDYVKTIFKYDLIMPVRNPNIADAKNFIKNILYHYFLKATNIYYEHMENSYSLESKRALLNLLHLACGVKKENNKVINNLYNKKDYYNLYTYIKNLVYSHPTYNNMYILYLLLQDYITKNYFEGYDEENYYTLVELVKHKNYEQMLKYYQNINYREEDNSEINIILDVLKNIIKEKESLSYSEIKEEKRITHIDKDKFLDFLISVEDVVEKEGFVILNPENKETNKLMRDLAYYIPTLASYEIGGKQKQVVINTRRNHAIAFNDSIFDLKKEIYSKGDSFAYIEYALEHLKYIIPSESDAAKLAQSYFRVGLIDEGLRALKLAIGLKKYENKTIYTSNMLNYCMIQDYFTNKKAKIMARNRQK